MFWLPGAAFSVTFAAQLLVTAAEASGQSATADTQAASAATVGLAALIVAAISALAATASAVAAWYSAKEATRSSRIAEKALEPARSAAEAAQIAAAAAEATAQVATWRELVASPERVDKSFGQRLPAERGYEVAILFRNTGQQAMRVSVPQVSCDPPSAFWVHQHEFIIPYADGQGFPAEDEGVVIRAAGEAEIKLRLAFSEDVASSGGGCTGTLRFPVAPRMSNGGDTIEIRCKFRAHADD